MIFEISQESHQVFDTASATSMDEERALGSFIKIVNKNMSSILFQNANTPIQEPSQAGTETEYKITPVSITL